MVELVEQPSIAERGARYGEGPGAIDASDLGPNDAIVVDSGHMVAWDNSVETHLRRAAAGGLMQSAKSGEGFVFDIHGPGRIWTQSRNAASSWLG